MKPYKQPFQTLRQEAEAIHRLIDNPPKQLIAQPLRLASFRADGLKAATRLCVAEFSKKPV